MDRNFFNIQMGRLRDTYGEKQFPTERVELYWSQYNHLGALEFKKAIDHVIANNRYAPMGTDLSESLAGSMAARRDEKVEALKKRQECWSCKNLGRVSIKLRENEADYSFRCHCRMGKELFPNFPKAPKPKQESDAQKEQELDF